MVCSNCAFCRHAESFNISVCDFRLSNKNAFTVENTIVVDFKSIETGHE